MPIRRVPFLFQADERAKRIETGASQVRTHLTDVEDKTPWWAQLMGNVVLLGILGCVLALCLYLGIGPLSKKLWALAGSMLPSAIPGATRAQAQLDAEAVTTGQVTPKQSRSIEGRKVSDPLYRTAFRQEIAKAKERA